MRGRKKNQGSATVEMTLLMPFLIGVLFLYVNVFLFFLEEAKEIRCMAQTLYATEEKQDNSMEINIRGEQLSICEEKAVGWFLLDLELHRKADIEVKSIRRWQLARSLF